MTFEAIPDLLANILAEQQRTTEAVTKLAEAIAGIKTKPAPVPRETKEPKAEAKPAESVTEVAEPVTEPPKAGIVTDPAATLKVAQDLLMGMPRPDAVAILGKFGVKRLTELDASKYAEVIAACRAK